MGVPSAAPHARHAEAHMMNFFSLSRKPGWFVGTLSLILVGFSGCVGPDRPIKVVVKNDGGTSIQDVHVRMKNGLQVASAILPGQSATFTIHPSDESNLEFEFRRGENDWRHAIFFTFDESDTFDLKIDDEGICWYHRKESSHDVAFAVLMPPSSAPRITSKWMQGQMSYSQDQTEVSGQLEAINLDAAPTRGPSAAPVTLVEFCDFGYSGCAQFSEVAKRLLADYPTQVRVAFKHYPWTESSWIAHEAAAAAGEQGKFWDMHDLLFAREEKFSRDGMIAKAKQLNLNVPRFIGDLDSHRVRAIVDADREEGSRRQVLGPPKLYINRHVVSNPMVFADFKHAVDFVLKEATARPVK
jgi:protein-disulfide isomerase